MVVVWMTMMYGVLLLAGGLMGYFMAGSKVSLFAGGGFGLLAVAAAILMLRRFGMAGWGLALAVTLLVGGYFGWQLLQGAGGAAAGRFAGILVLSLVELVVLVAGRTSLPG